MTQFEFDKQMCAINAAQYAEKKDVEKRIEELNAKKRAILCKIREIKNELESQYIELAFIKDERSKELTTIQAINCRYHEMKHQFAIEHPKESMEDGVV